MPKVQLWTGIRCFYERTGSGSPIVLVPGTSMTHEIWGLQVAALAKSFTVIAIDPRGAGQTDAPADAALYSVAIMADDIAALLDACGIKAAHIAGLSLGSAIAQEFALRHRQRTLSIQLHATWARSDAWFKQVFCDTMRHFLDSGDMRGLFKFGQGMIMSPAFLEERGPPEVFQMVTRCLVKNPHPTCVEGLKGQLNADSTHNTLGRLKDIDIPTLVTAGQLDANTPERYGREVHANIRNSKLHYFQGPRSSHCALWEMAEEFNLIIQEFLTSIPHR